MAIRDYSSDVKQQRHSFGPADGARRRICQKQIAIPIPIPHNLRWLMRVLSWQSVKPRNGSGFIGRVASRM
jgi:hypothetical protein